jgi:hypothetical protein
MRIKSWHTGKIVMLWAWGGALLIVDRHVQKDYVEALDKHMILGWVSLSLFLFIPLILSIVTWIWFSGKEDGANASAGVSEPSESCHRTQGKAR